MEGEQESYARLIDRMRSGDQGALNELFKKHRGTVFWTAMRALFSRSDPEEIPVDAFLTFGEKRKKVALCGEPVLP